jgi:hypothetical protein
MKMALLPSGKEIAADPSAPATAVCPRCGCVVVLRTRRSMRGRIITYFWRHASQGNVYCVERWSPLSR